MRVRDDPAAIGLGRLGQAPLVDQEGRLLLRLRDDPFRLVLGLLDDPFALGVDPLGGADLLGDRDAELVDQSKGRVLVDDDVGGEGELLPVRDERFEALDEEDDVDRSALLARLSRPCPRRLSMARGPPGQGRARAPSRAARAAVGTIDDTSPPNVAISLTRLELT